MAFVAGAYTVTYDGTTIGQIQNGITMTYFTVKEAIRGDQEGQTVQDSVYQGKEMFVSFTLMEWNLTKAQLAIWPYGAGTWGKQGVIGRTDVENSLAKQLVFTVTPGTPASLVGAGPSTITIPRAIIREDVPVRVPIASRLRAVDLQMRCYPDDNGVLFTKSDPS